MSKHITISPNEAADRLAGCLRSAGSTSTGWTSAHCHCGRTGEPRVEWLARRAVHKP